MLTFVTVSESVEPSDSPKVNLVWESSTNNIDLRLTQGSKLQLSFEISSFFYLQRGEIFKSIETTSFGLISSNGANMIELSKCALIEFLRKAWWIFSKSITLVDFVVYKFARGRDESRIGPIAACQIFLQYIEAKN